MYLSPKKKFVIDFNSLGGNSLRENLKALKNIFIVKVAMTSSI